MLADPDVGDHYYQEFFAGEAEDEAVVAALGLDVSTGLGDFSDVLQIYETTALEPDHREFKYYAPGVGLILIEEDLNEEPGGPRIHRGVGRRAGDSRADVAFAGGRRPRRPGLDSTPLCGSRTQASEMSRSEHGGPSSAAAIVRFCIRIPCRNSGPLPFRQASPEKLPAFHHVLIVL